MASTEPAGERQAQFQRLFTEAFKRWQRRRASDDSDSSQKALAKSLGVSQSTVTSWLKGRRAPDERDRALLAKLARELAIPEAELIGFGTTPDIRIQEFAAHYGGRFSEVERQIREIRAAMLEAAGLSVALADAQQSSRGDEAQPGRSERQKGKKRERLPDPEKAAEAVLDAQPARPDAVSKRRSQQ